MFHTTFPIKIDSLTNETFEKVSRKRVRKEFCFVNEML